MVNGKARVLREGGRAFSLAVLLIAALSAYGQSAPGQTAAPGALPAHEGARLADYAVGPGDVLNITVGVLTANVGEAPEVSAKYRVTDDGYIVLPLLSAPVKVEGLTALEVSRTISDRLKSAELFKEPVVNVFVDEYHSRTITVLGAVQRPSVYPLQKPTTVLEALSLAGGLTPTAGTSLTILHKGLAPGAEGTAPAAPGASLDQSTVKIDLGKLQSGKDASLNVNVEPGDVLTVSLAPVVYVVGAVNKPGGFALQDPTAGITVLKALALAEGLKSTAARGRSLIYRQLAYGNQVQEIPIDVVKLMDGKAKDQPLEGNDVLFIPESNAKRRVQGLTQNIGTSAVSALIYGVTIYGLAPKF